MNTVPTTIRTGETKPFRSPHFPKMRIIVQASGWILHSKTRERLARVSENGVVFVQGKKARIPDVKLTFFAETDFVPVIKKLRAEQEQALNDAKAKLDAKRNAEIGAHVRLEVPALELAAD